MAARKKKTVTEAPAVEMTRLKVFIFFFLPPLTALFLPDAA